MQGMLESIPRRTDGHIACTPSMFEAAPVPSSTDADAPAAVCLCDGTVTTTAESLLLYAHNKGVTHASDVSRASSLFTRGYVCHF